MTRISVIIFCMLLKLIQLFCLVLLYARNRRVLSFQPEADDVYCSQLQNYIHAQSLTLQCNIAFPKKKQLLFHLLISFDT